MNRIKQKIFEELFILLREHNRDNKRILLKILNSPFIVTFLGGLIVVIITLIWQSSQQQYAIELEYEKNIVQQKYKLFNSYTALFTKKAHIVNEYMIRVLKLADKSRSKNSTKEKISELYKLYKEYSQLESPGILLLQIEFLFDNQDVKIKAKEMESKWLEFTNLFNQINNDYKTNQLNQDSIKNHKDQRKSLLKNCQNLNNRLILSILGELSKASKK